MIAGFVERSLDKSLFTLKVASSVTDEVISHVSNDLRSPGAEYPDVLRHAAELRAPHRVTTWVRDFASRLHGFYRDCRVLTDDDAVTQARLWLVEATRVGLASALAILGVTAPEVMERLDVDDADPDVADPAAADA